MKASTLSAPVRSEAHHQGVSLLVVDWIKLNILPLAVVLFPVNYKEVALLQVHSLADYGHSRLLWDPQGPVALPLVGITSWIPWRLNHHDLAVLQVIGLSAGKRVDLTLL